MISDCENLVSEKLSRQLCSKGDKLFDDALSFDLQMQKRQSFLQ